MSETRNKTREKADKAEKDPTRVDWEGNQALISQAFFDLLSSKKKLPTIKEMAEKTQLSEKTIERHLKTPSFKKNLETLRAGQPVMLAAFYVAVLKSKNPKFWELYWQLTEPEFASKLQPPPADSTHNITLNLG